jgi:hypothetical protein
MVNVLPVAEEELHEMATTCPCGPKVECKEQVLVVHRSFLGEVDPNSTEAGNWGVYESED